MKIIIAAINKIGSNPEAQLITNYLTRIHWSVNIKELEIKKQLEPLKLREQEGELLLKNIPQGYYKIILDEEGKMLTSKEFANGLNKLRDTGRDKIAFLIGGANGHSDNVRQQADMLLSLSRMTLPHMLARLVLIEQLYRGYTIINNHPYHK